MLCLTELKETFAMFDIDGDGRITKVELEKMMKQMGQTPSQDELDNIMKNADTDGKTAAGCYYFIQAYLTSYRKYKTYKCTCLQVNVL